MIIFRSKKFVYVRVPKTASTSGLFYFMESGLYNPDTDVHFVDFPFSDWNELYESFKRKDEDYMVPVRLKIMARDFPENKGEPLYKNVHMTFDQMTKTFEDVNYLYDCYAGVRNPIDRMCSNYFYEKKTVLDGFDSVVKSYISDKDLNTFCYETCSEDAPEEVKLLNMPQCCYFPPHANLWNIENFHEHATNSIRSLGGEVSDKIHVRKNNLKPKNYKDFLSKEVVDRIKEKYEQDFLMWENAYAVYN